MARRFFRLVVVLLVLGTVVGVAAVGGAVTGRHRVARAHARTVTVPASPAQSCPVAGRACSLHPCVLFAGAGWVVLRLQTAVLFDRSRPAGRGALRRTVATIAPAAGRRGRRAAGCRRLRAAGAVSIS